jgi:hypothetical protein
MKTTIKFDQRRALCAICASITESKTLFLNAADESGTLVEKLSLMYLMTPKHTKTIRPL